MKEFELKYGCNPNQKPARIFMEDGSDLPIEILNGRPGYINFLDAFNSWQLVKELSEATGLPAATSFKHVSPTSGAVAVPMSAELKKAAFVDDIEGLDDSPIACSFLSQYKDTIAASSIYSSLPERSEKGPLPYITTVFPAYYKKSGNN